MIYVRVELWPLGDRNKASVLGEAFIRNDGTGTQSSGNYTYRINGRESRQMNYGRVIHFPRRAKHVWNLLKLVLNDAR